MRRPTFIARQAGRPSGLFGRALGAIMAIETRSLNDEVLRRLAVAPGERILEIGFGHGRTLERAVRSNPDAHFAGVDHAEDMVTALRRRARRLGDTGRLEVRAGRSTLLPWTDGAFDAAYAVHTIYFWKQPPSAILPRFAAFFDQGDACCSDSASGRPRSRRRCPPRSTPTARPRRSRRS